MENVSTTRGHFHGSWLLWHCLLTVRNGINSLLMPWLQLWFDQDATMIRLRRIAHTCFHLTRFDASKKWTCQFFVVVVSHSNRTHILISITCLIVVECIVVSSYHSRIIVESQLWYRLNTRGSYLAVSHPHRFNSSFRGKPGLANYPLMLSITWASSWDRPKRFISILTQTSRKSSKVGRL